MEYLENHNAAPKPFVWTKSADEILKKVARAKQALEVKTLDPNPETPRRSHRERPDLLKANVHFTAFGYAIGGLLIQCSKAYFGAVGTSLSHGLR